MLSINEGKTEITDNIVHTEFWDFIIVFISLKQIYVWDVILFKEEE